jgi:hypothetical protein
MKYGSDTRIWGAGDKATTEIRTLNTFTWTCPYAVKKDTTFLVFCILVEILHIRGKKYTDRMGKDGWR